MAKDKKQKSNEPNFELNQKLDQMVEEGMEKTNRWTELWDEALRYFFGEQLAGKRLHRDWDYVVLNYIFPSAMQEIAKLSKNHPKILAHPWEESDTEYAEAWQSKLQWDWQRGINGTGMRLEQIGAILDGKLYGYRIGKVFWEPQSYWDDEKKTWMGDAKFRLWHPAQFWASDDEKVDDGDCGTVRYVSLDWAIRRWPKFEDELRQEATTYVQKDVGARATIPGSYSATSSADAIAAGRSGGRSESSLRRLGNKIVSLVLGTDKTDAKPSNIEIVKIEEIYFKDYSTSEQADEEDIEPQELLQTGEVTMEANLFYDKNGNLLTHENWPKRTVREYDEPKFPNGRFIVRCGHTILNPTEEDQVYPYSKWPFVIIPHYMLPHMWQGLNAVELYKSPQDMINLSVSHLFNNMKLFGDPKIAIEQGAMAINPKTKKAYKVGSMVGAVFRLARGGLQKFKIFDPPAPSAGALLLYKLFAQEFKNLTGLQAIARGEKQEGRMTATEAQHLAVTSHDRIALQSAFEEAWIKGVVERIAEVTQKNYSVGRMVRTIGEDRLVGAIQIAEEHKTVKFDVEIVVGSQLPFDEEKQQARYLQAYKLFSDPNPNPMLPEVLRILEIGNWKKLINQHRPWILWNQFLGLYESVKAGQTTPQQATQIILRETIRISLESTEAQALPAQQ